MIKWILLAVLALLILLSLVLRVGVLAGYGKEGAFVKIRVGPGYIKVYPLEKDPEKEQKKKEKKAEKKAKKAEKEAKKPPKPKKKIDPGGALGMVRELLPVVDDAAKKFGKKLQIDELDVILTWAGKDPADAAIRYGQAWAVAENLMSFLENCFVIKERQVEITVDFYREKPLIYIQAGLSLTPAQLTYIGLPAAVKGLKIFLAHRKKLFKPTEPEKTGAEETVKGELNHGKEPSDQ